ncbi:hypothetical protein [Mesorhizobium sp. 10J20-29]
MTNAASGRRFSFVRHPAAGRFRAAPSLVYGFSGPFCRIVRKSLMSNTFSREQFAHQAESIPARLLTRQAKYRADSALSG